jgi:hypothetical protein
VIRVASESASERFFMVAEPSQVKAIQIAKKKIPVRDGDDLTLGLSVSTEELASAGMKPGDVKQHG